VVLIVEDDANFARVLLDIAHQNRFKGLIALNAKDAVTLARRYAPDAITLDIGLPGRDGWAVYDTLVHDPATAGIPVHVISVREEDQIRGAEEGLTFLTKPVTKDTLGDLFGRIKGRRARSKSLLVIEDDAVQRREIVDQFSRPGLEILAVGAGADALNMLASRTFDCIVLDLGLPDMTGFEFIEKVQEDPIARAIPIVVYTAVDLSRRAQSKLKKTTRSVVHKDPESHDELTEQVVHFLRGLAPADTRPQAAGNGHHEGNGRSSKPRPAGTTATARPRGATGRLTGKRVLVVDDDVRNIYALTALLERSEAVVVSAETGRQAIEILRSMRDIDAVLMDVMMPEMDGFETTRAIRQMPEMQGLPIIALTAKAMQGDRERCLDAGASDYIAKPVDGTQLIELVHRWTVAAGAGEPV
jgi:CheY-like chemotaxis protein